MSNEDFDKKLKAVNDNLNLVKRCSESEKRLFDAYRFLLEMEGITNV